MRNGSLHYNLGHESREPVTFSGDALRNSIHITIVIRLQPAPQGVGEHLLGQTPLEQVCFFFSSCINSSGPLNFWPPGSSPDASIAPRRPSRASGRCRRNSPAQSRSGPSGVTGGAHRVFPMLLHPLPQRSYQAAAPVVVLPVVRHPARPAAVGAAACREAAPAPICPASRAKCASGSR